MAISKLSKSLRDGSLTGQVVKITFTVFLTIFMVYVLLDWSAHNTKASVRTNNAIASVNALMEKSIQDVVDHNERIELKELMALLLQHRVIAGISLNLVSHQGKSETYSVGSFKPEQKTALISLMSFLPEIKDQVLLTSTLRGPLAPREKWVGVLQVNFSVNELYSSHEKMVIRHLFVLLSMVLTGICLGLIFHQRIQKPIRKILQAMESSYVGNSPNHSDIQAVGQRDLDQLIHGFNYYQHFLIEADESKRKQIAHLEHQMEEKTGYLRAALEKSHVSEKNQQRVFQMLSHDLKEAILTSQFQAEALRRNVNFQYDKEVVGQIVRLGQAMGDAYDKLEEILAFSTTQANAPALTIEKIDLYREAEASLEKLGYLASNKGISLDLIFDPTLPSGIEASKDGVRQIINALVSSAIKETLAGGVSIEMSRGEDIVDAGFYLHLDVKASCPALNPNVVASLRKAASHGVVAEKESEINAIALRIALSRLREMNATFEIQSAINTTHCTIRIPVLVSDDAMSLDQQAAKKATRGKNMIFIVPSASAMFSKNVASRLGYLGQRVFSVVNANELKKLVVDHPQDKLVLVGQRLCSLEMHQAFMPLAEVRKIGLACIISLEYQSNHEEDLLFPNRDAPDVKQDMMVQMRTLISRAVTHCYPSSSQVHEIFIQQSPILEAETLKDAKILVVDDTSAVLDGMSEYLRNYGAEVVTLRSAVEAAKRTKEEHFDAVCTDISMPQMSGIELAFEIRQSVINARTPIVGMTAAVLTEQEISDTSMVGMTVLNKNGIMDLVMTTLCTQIHKARSGGAGARGHLRAIDGSLTQDAKLREGD